MGKYIKQANIITTIGWLIICGAWYALGYYHGSQQSITRAVEQFDHSQCQYPNRVSNPPNGCDNTDPARPECMKIGTEDCDLPTQEPEVVVEVPIIKDKCEE